MSDVDNIVFKCRHCSAGISVGIERAGRAMHCISCRCVVRIPPACVPVKMDESGVTLIGLPAAFDTQVVPAICDVEIITSDGVKRSASLQIGGRKTPAASPMRRIGVPVGTGMLIAAGLVLALAIILRTNAGPKRAVAGPDAETKKSATQP
jgi:hypothetical protein